jgi:1,2-dihydroxy-3-keto-5-methylthiopentene dioxygenase
MTRLRTYHEDQPTVPRFDSNDFAAIQARLAQAGVRFERWQATADIRPGDSQDAVIAAYRADIDRLMAEADYQAVDVISLTPDHPDKAALRQKFLNEHTHAEDEVRFFVAGRGLFTLHLGNEVLEILCEKDDLIGVPAGTRHWFDMGPEPSFVAIRIFTNPAGWVANFTGDQIASRFPRLDAVA